MSGRPGRLAVVLAAGLLALMAALSAAGHLRLDLPDATSAIDSDLPVARLAPGTMPTRVKPMAAKHGRTAPLVPAATLVAVVALLLYGLGIAGAPTLLGRLHRTRSWTRSPRAPPARLSI